MKAIVLKLEILREKKEKLIEMYIYEERIDSTVFETQNMKLIMQIDQLELELAEKKDLELDIDSLVNGAIYSLKNAARMWMNGDIHQRINLQNALFPEGLLFSMKEGIGTPLTPLGFNVLELINQPKCKVAGHLNTLSNFGYCIYRIQE